MGLTSCIVLWHARENTENIRRVVRREKALLHCTDVIITSGIVKRILIRQLETAYLDPYAHSL